MFGVGLVTVGSLSLIWSLYWRIKSLFVFYVGTDELKEKRVGITAIMGLFSLISGVIICL